MKILVSLLPFLNLQAYLIFQKVNEVIHGETIKTSSKFPWIFDVKKPSFLKFLGWPIIWHLGSLSSSSLLVDGMSWHSNICFTSHTRCLQVTYDLNFALMICKLDSCKFKVLFKIFDSYHLFTQVCNYKSDT